MAVPCFLSVKTGFVGEYHHSNHLLTFASVSIDQNRLLIRAYFYHILAA